MRAAFILGLRSLMFIALEYDVYSRAAFINIFALKYGVYSRAV